MQSQNQNDAKTVHDLLSGLQQNATTRQDLELLLQSTSNEKSALSRLNARYKELLAEESKQQEACVQNVVYQKKISGTMTQIIEKQGTACNLAKNLLSFDDLKTNENEDDNMEVNIGDTVKELAQTEIEISETIKQLCSQIESLEVQKDEDKKYIELQKNVPKELKIELTALEAEMTNAFSEHRDLVMQINDREKDVEEFNEHIAQIQQNLQEKQTKYESLQQEQTQLKSTLTELKQELKTYKLEYNNLIKNVFNGRKDRPARGATTAEVALHLVEINLNKEEQLSTLQNSLLQIELEYIKTQEEKEQCDLKKVSQIQTNVALAEQVQQLNFETLQMRTKISNYTNQSHNTLEKQIHTFKKEIDQFRARDPLTSIDVANAASADQLTNDISLINDKIKQAKQQAKQVNQQHRKYQEQINNIDTMKSAFQDQIEKLSIENEKSKIKLLNMLHEKGHASVPYELTPIESNIKQVNKTLSTYHNMKKKLDNIESDIEKLQLKGKERQEEFNKQMDHLNTLPEQQKNTTLTLSYQTQEEYQIVFKETMQQFREEKNKLEKQYQTLKQEQGNHKDSLMSHPHQMNY